jgi:hypothetical protein
LPGRAAEAQPRKGINHGLRMTRISFIRAIRVHPRSSVVGIRVNWRHSRFGPLVAAMPRWVFRGSHPLFLGTGLIGQQIPPHPGPLPGGEGRGEGKRDARNAPGAQKQICAGSAGQT